MKVALAMDDGRLVCANDALGNGAQVFLLPGQWHFGLAPGTVETLLGSCVSVALWDSRSRAGGLCHFVLPERARARAEGERKAHSHSADGRYGDEAIALVAGAARSHGIDLTLCHVWIAGGASMLAPGTAAAAIDVGPRNLELARRACAEWKLRVTGEHSGGALYRRIRLDLSTGAFDVRSGSMTPPVAIDVPAASRSR